MVASWSCPSCADAGRGVSPRHTPTTSDNSTRSHLECATLTITPAPPANLPRSNEILDGGGGYQPDPANASGHDRQISRFCHVRLSEDLTHPLPSNNAPGKRATPLPVGQTVITGNRQPATIVDRRIAGAQRRRAAWTILHRSTQLAAKRMKGATVRNNRGTRELSRHRANSTPRVAQAPATLWSPSPCRRQGGRWRSSTTPPPPAPPRPPTATTGAPPLRAGPDRGFAWPA